MKYQYLRLSAIMSDLAHNIFDKNWQRIFLDTGDVLTELDFYAYKDELYQCVKDVVFANLDSLARWAQNCETDYIDVAYVSRNGDATEIEFKLDRECETELCLYIAQINIKSEKMLCKKMYIGRSTIEIRR